MIALINRLPFLQYFDQLTRTILAWMCLGLVILVTITSIAVGYAEDNHLTHPTWQFTGYMESTGTGPGTQLPLVFFLTGLRDRSVTTFSGNILVEYALVNGKLVQHNGAYTASLSASNVLSFTIHLNNGEVFPAQGIYLANNDIQVQFPPGTLLGGFQFITLQCVPANYADFNREDTRMQRWLATYKP